MWNYEEMWGWVKDWKSWWYGINQYASPEIGEGIGIFTSGTSGRSGTAHFAGVIGKSGHDAFMLETTRVIRGADRQATDCRGWRTRTGMFGCSVQ